MDAKFDYGREIRSMHAKFDLCMRMLICTHTVWFLHAVSFMHALLDLWMRKSIYVCDDIINIKAGFAITQLEYLLILNPPQNVHINAYLVNGLSTLDRHFKYILF